MIRAFHIHKVYEAGDVPALNDVSLRIEKGEFVFLTGASGAGKSTLLKLLFAAERPSRGQLFVNGQDVGRLRTRAVARFRRTLGIVFQDFKLIPHRTVAENVAMTLWVCGRPEREIRRRVSATLKAVGLTHRAHALPPKLSGGEQQRAAIARALINDPVLLIADEPTGNLDPSLSHEVMGLLEKANARGTTVLMATHDQGLIERYPRRTLTLRDGGLTGDRAL
ncbi:MAG TPA: cell division ATP-binding protein FtsE [Myxococcales bacterium LLY-WYZ-16_1]|nr:cell division ATP-binding protein FtsE [Myxococcales bacterium LLY-WYZ-16_1]